MVCSPRLRTVAHPLTLSLSKGVSLSKRVTGTRAHSAVSPTPNAEGAGPALPLSPGGVQRGFPSFWGGEPLWGMCPQLSKNLWGGAGRGS